MADRFQRKRHFVGPDIGALSFGPVSGHHKLGGGCQQDRHLFQPPGANAADKEHSAALLGQKGRLQRNRCPVLALQWVSWYQHKGKSHEIIESQLNSFCDFSEKLPLSWT